MLKHICLSLLLVHNQACALWNLAGIENSSDLVLEKLCYGNGNLVPGSKLQNNSKFSPAYGIGQASKGVNSIQGKTIAEKKVEISFDGYPTGFLKKKNGIPGLQGYKSTAGAESCDYGKKCARVFIEIDGVLVAQCCKQFEQDKEPSFVIKINQNGKLYSVSLIESFKNNVLIT